MTAAKLSAVSVDEEKKSPEKAGNESCSVLNKLTLLTYQYETKQEDG